MYATVSTKLITTCSKKSDDDFEMVQDRSFGGPGARAYTIHKE